MNTWRFISLLVNFPIHPWKKGELSDSTTRIGNWSSIMRTQGHLHRRDENGNAFNYAGDYVSQKVKWIKPILANRKSLCKALFVLSCRLIGTQDFYAIPEVGNLSSRAVLLILSAQESLYDEVVEWRVFLWIQLTGMYWKKNVHQFFISDCDETFSIFDKNKQWRNSLRQFIMEEVSYSTSDLSSANLRTTSGSVRLLSSKLRQVLLDVFGGTTPAISSINTAWIATSPSLPWMSSGKVKWERAS